MALSLDELLELLACATDGGHEVELVHAYYGRAPLLTASELEGIASVLFQYWPAHGDDKSR